MKNELFLKAKEANKLSYSPYSNFKVSAAVLLSDGTIMTGVNVENSSYSLAICAERCAIFKAISSGYSSIVSILIYTNGVKSMPYPCGACRQVMSEFMTKDSKVYVANDELIEEYTLDELLPHSFTKEELK